MREETENKRECEKARIDVNVLSFLSYDKYEREERERERGLTRERDEKRN